MLRRLFTLFSALSLLVCVASIVLSVWRASILTDFSANGTDYRVGCDNGTVGWVARRYVDKLPGTGLLTVVSYDWDTHAELLGFEFGSGYQVEGAVRWHVVALMLPLWFLALMAAVPPLEWIRRRRRNGH